MDHRYVQKSKLFLLPLIELKKDKYIKPKGTYVASETIKPSDCKLIVPFEKEDSSEFNYYETNYILTSRGLIPEDYTETDKLRVYVFDLSPYMEDYKVFLKGSYTLFTKKTKGFINMYWGAEHYNKFYPHPKIDAYLNPTYSTYEQLARELNVPVKDLLEVGQLLNPPDFDKETFKYISQMELNEEELETES